MEEAAAPSSPCNVSLQFQTFLSTAGYSLYCMLVPSKKNYYLGTFSENDLRMVIFVSQAELVLEETAWYSVYQQCVDASQHSWF